MGKPPNNNESNAFALMVCEDTLENITEDSPREERIATAIALINMGSSINNAALATFLPPKTVWDRYYKEPKRKDEREEYIEQLAFEGTVMASEAILKMIEEGTMRPAEVTKALTVMRDTVAQRRKWNTPPVEIVAEKETALEKLIRALEKEREARSEGTIDVTPEEKP